MHRSVATLGLMACLGLGACGDDEPDGGPAARDGAGTGSELTAGETSLALVRGADTVMVERYTLAGDRVSGTMTDPNGGSVQYEAVHTAGGERSMRITVNSGGSQAGQPAAGATVTTFTLRGDSAFMRREPGDSIAMRGERVPAGTLPYMSPSIGMMALLVQSARGVVGDSGQVPLLAVSAGQEPMVVEPVIRWSADTAWVSGNPSSRFRLVFAGGRLVSAENPPQQVRAVLAPAGGEAPAP